MVRESAWKRTKAYIRRMRNNKAGGWIALLLLFLVDVQCVTSTIPIANETIQYRLPTNVIPTSYDIKFETFIGEENFTFNGETEIFIKVLDEIMNITLHAHHDLEVNENATNLLDADGKLVKLKFHYRDNKTDFLILSFEQPIKPGRYSLNLKFAGNTNNRLFGIYKSSYVNAKNEKSWVISTQFSPIRARRAFPCWDEPALKATFNIFIKHSSNYTASSNMPIKNQTDAGNGKQWTQFYTTPVMSTYLVAFVVSDFQCISNADKTINTCVPKDKLSTAKYLQEISEKALPLLQEYTGESYKLPKLDSYAIPEAEYGGTENWGLITYRTSILTTDNSTYTAIKSATDTAIHALAQQWFGNLVTPAWWKYKWLKEGLSRYMQFYIGDKIFPERNLMDLLVPRALHTDAYEVDETVYYYYLNSEKKSPADIESYAAGSDYDKGVVVIEVLSHIIGKKSLQEGIRIYLRKHQYGVATSDDFWHAMQQANDDYGFNKEIKIKDLMDPWIEQKGYPIVKVTRNYKAGSAILTQSPNLPSEISNRWYVPINFATKSKPSFTCTRPKYWLKPNDADMTIEELNKDDWIIVNLKQSGYYRVDYDEENWLKIAAYLNSDNFTKIHPTNRAQIMNDLVYLVVHNRQNLTTFLEVSKYLVRETEFIPWRQAFQSFLTLRNQIQEPEFSANMQKYAHDVMEKVINKVGLEENDNDSYITKRWKSTISTYAKYYGDEEYDKQAKDKLVAFLNDPKGNPMPLRIVEYILYMNIYDERADTIIQKKMNSGDYSYTRFLNVAKNRTFFHEFMNKTLKNSTISKNVMLTMLQKLKNGGDENWNYAVNYFIENCDRIYEYFNNNDMASTAMDTYMWSATTIEGINKIDEFYEMNKERMEPWTMNYRIEMQRQKIKWSAINKPIFNNWIKKERGATAND